MFREEFEKFIYADSLLWLLEMQLEEIEKED